MWVNTWQAYRTWLVNNVAKSGAECGVFHTHLQKEFGSLQKVLKFMIQITDTVCFKLEIYSCSFLDLYIN